MLFLLMKTAPHAAKRLLGGAGQQAPGVSEDDQRGTSEPGSRRAHQRRNGGRANKEGDVVRLTVSPSEYGYSGRVAALSNRRYSVRLDDSSDGTDGRLNQEPHVV